MTESTIEAATRVAAGDDKTRYDAFAITLHWLTVLLVLEQFVTSLIWGSFAKPTKHALIVGHMSFGMILTAVIAIRIVWRLLPGHQRPLALSGWVEAASKVVHYSLYLLLAAVAVLGFVLRWSGKESMSFFGLEIPPIIPALPKPTHHLVAEAHQYVGWTIIGLASGHAGAALWHHYVVKDDVLRRMIPWRQSQG